MPNTETATRRERAKPSRRRTDHGLGLVEESYCLLRSSPLSTLVIFYIGAVPFVAALFYFWADMSRSSFAIEDAAWSAFGAALAYVWMKTAQAWFCRRLWSQVNSEGDLPKLSGAKLAGHLASHALIQSLALPLLVLSALFMVPLAWVYAFFQNATVLALTRDADDQPLRGLVSRAATLSHWQWGANHVTMGITALAGVLVWANLIMFAVLAPQLLKWLFGVESVFTLFPLASLSNTSFLFATLLGTFLIIGPLAKAIYVMRCFYGDSRRSGVDLLSRLATIRRRSVALAAGVGLIFCVTSATGQNEEMVVETTTKVDALDSAIQQTLEGKAYQWRMSRDFEGAGLAKEGDEEKGLTAMIRSAFERFAESLKRLFEKLFDPERSGGSDAGHVFGENYGEMVAAVVSVASLVLIVGLIIWAVVQVRRRAKSAGLRAESVDSLPADASLIDLEQDDLVASQLPEDEWLRLAREQIGAGEYRLAVRALFLGCLAHLGERKLISVARHKSNRDYETELALKARSLPVLRDAFGENVGLFERAWYGVHTVDQATGARFAENCERIAAERSVAAPSAVVRSTREVAHD